MDEKDFDQDSPGISDESLEGLGNPKDEDESKPDFLSLDDSREIRIPDGKPSEEEPSYDAELMTPPFPEKPLSQEQKKTSEDFSFDLDLSPEATKARRREELIKGPPEKHKPSKRESERIRSAPLVTERPQHVPYGTDRDTAEEATEVKSSVPPPRSKKAERSPEIRLTETAAPPRPAPPKAKQPQAASEETETGEPVSSKTSWPRYLVLAILLALAGMLSYRHISNFDIWWHINSGKDLITEKALPGNDKYSFTASDEKVFTPYPVSQAVLAFLNDKGGIKALIIFKTVLIVLGFFVCVMAALGKRGPGAVVLWLALCALFAANARLLIRPHLISLVLAPLFLLICLRHEKQGSKWIWSLPLISVLWTNWHPSWVVGPMIVFAFLLGNLIFYFYGITYDEKKAEIKRTAWLAPVLLLTIAAAFLTPNLVDGFLHPFRQLTTISDVNEGVAEWVSPLKGLTLLSTKLIYFKILVVLGILSFFVNWKQQRLSHLFVFGGSLVLVLTSYRHIALFAVVCVPLAACNLNAFTEKPAFQKISKLLSPALLVALIGLISYLAIGIYTNDYYRSRRLYSLQTGIGISKIALPVLGVKNFSKNKIAGNGFHNYHFGGYISYALGKETKIFMDGRLTHYPKSVMADYRLLKSEPEKWSEIAKKPEYALEWAMLTHATGEFMGLIKHLWELEDWKPVYIDSSVITFVKASGVNAEVAYKVELDSLGQLKDYSSKDFAYDVFHYRQTGRLFTELGEYSWAISQLNMAMAKAEKKPYALPDVKIDLGRVALLQRDFDTAKKHFGEVIDKPGYSDARYRAHIGLGEVGLRLEPPDPDSAFRHFKQALAINPGSVDAHLGLARVAIKRGRVIEAERQIEKALKIDPDSAEAHKQRKLLQSP